MDANHALQDNAGFSTKEVSAMSRRLLTCALLPLAVGIATSCDGSDPKPFVPDEEFQQFQECAGIGIDRTGGVFGALLDLMVVVADPLAEYPSHVIYHSETNEFFVGADLDGDGFTEAVVEGLILTTADLSDGMQVGESVSAEWAIGIGVPVTGSGTFQVQMLSDTAVRVAGSLSISGDEGCDFAVRAMDLTVETAAGAEAFPIGSFDFSVTSASDTMSAQITFNGSHRAVVSTLYQGRQVNYVIDLNTGNVIR